MFTKVLVFLKGFFDWIGWLFGEAWKGASFLVWSVWSWILVVTGMVWSLWDFLGRTVNVVISIIEGITMPSGDLSCSAARTGLEFANTFLPVQEFFNALLGYGLLIGALLLYRSLKSLKSWFWAS